MSDTLAEEHFPQLGALCDSVAWNAKETAFIDTPNTSQRDDDYDPRAAHQVDLRITVMDDRECIRCKKIM